MRSAFQRRYVLGILLFLSKTFRERNGGLEQFQLLAESLQKSDYEGNGPI